MICLWPLAARAAGPSAADDGCLRDETCRGHYERAVELFGSGKFEPALASFQAAYNLRQMPWLLLNIGRTLHRLGRPRDALTQYERFQQAEPHPDAETQQRLEKYMAQARELAGQGPAPGDGRLAAAGASGRDGGAADGEPRPVYKKWWFWTILGGVAVVAVTGIAVGVATSNRSEPLPSDVVVFRPSF